MIFPSRVNENVVVPKRLNECSMKMSGPQFFGISHFHATHVETSSPSADAGANFNKLLLLLLLLPPPPPLPPLPPPLSQE